MSKPYVPVQRRQNMIGCNIRPGMTPGGFSRQFGVARHPDHNKHHGSFLASEVQAAANATLARFGAHHEPSAYRDSRTPYGDPKERVPAGPLLELEGSRHINPPAETECKTT